MTINDTDQQRLKHDQDGLLTYEYLANHIDTIDGDDLTLLADNICRADISGQFTASAARYLHAIDPQRFAPTVCALVSSTIDKDREHKYLADILTGIYGNDYASQAERLCANDNNFRRIYKRLFPNSVI